MGKVGGVFRVTAGLYDEFGDDRVIDTPLSEGGIIGSAIGMALYGMKPVAEIQFGDFIFPAYDQIVSEAARLRYRSNGQFTAPLVVRMPTGGGIFGGGVLNLHAVGSAQDYHQTFSAVAGATASAPARATERLTFEQFINTSHRAFNGQFTRPIGKVTMILGGSAHQRRASHIDEIDPADQFIDAAHAERGVAQRHAGGRGGALAGG